ncbi:MAG: response regulator [Thermodesulfobacteriota bacterium]
MKDRPLVLVVDDDPDLVEMVSLKLESRNYRVAAAYDGVEAWDRIKAEKPDLIILDVMMPRKDGYKVCSEVKEDPVYQDIKIILLTAVGSAVTSTSYTHKDGLSTLADDYCPKPIDLDKLMELVEDYVG